MDCLRCLKGEGELAKLSYDNGDLQHIYLCESCRQHFETDDTVSQVAVASPA